MSVVKDHSATAVLILTQSRDPKLLTTVLEMGAAGYLVKPLLREEVMINISDALRRRARQSEDQRQREELGDLLSHRTDELETKTAQLAAAETEARFYRDEAVERLAAAAAMRGTESLGHIKRIGGYCELLARSMGESESHCDMIRQASKLHDIGMLAVPDHILFKREALSEEERKSMQSHTEIGHGILVGSESEVLSIAASVALTHHERVDGSGYPRGLRGEDIPLEGRIMAIADVFDGLASQRIYKSPVPTEQAIAEMRSIGEGKLDGDLLDLFVGSMEMVQAMVSEFDVG
jgi:putative two-component system response regulator